MDDSAPWKTEETIVGWSRLLVAVSLSFSQIWWPSPVVTSDLVAVTCRHFTFRHLAAVTCRHSSLFVAGVPGTPGSPHFWHGAESTTADRV